MKKQYLICLLGLIAISIPMENSLLNTNNYFVKFEEQNVETGIVLDKDKSNVYVADNHNAVVTKGDKIDAIKIDATYDKNSEITINWQNELFIYYSSTSNEHWTLEYDQINKYFLDDNDADGEEEGFIIVDGEVTGFSASINFKTDPHLFDPDHEDGPDESLIWSHSIVDDNPYNLSTTATRTVDGNEKVNQEFKIGPVSIELGYKDSTVTCVSASNMTDTSVDIKYTATPGKDIYGEDVTFESATLYDNKDEDGKILGTQDSSEEGIINVSGLPPDTTFETAEIRVKFSNEYWPIVEPVLPFTTDPAPKSSEVTIDKTTNITETSATINYSVDLASNETVESAILYKDNTAKQQLGVQIDNGVDESNKGTIDVSELEADTNYNNATLVITFSDGITGPISAPISDLHTIPISTNLEVGKIIGIIIGVLLLVGIIAWIGNILYRKAKENKINIEIDKAIKQ